MANNFVNFRHSPGQTFNEVSSAPDGGGGGGGGDRKVRWSAVRCAAGYLKCTD